MRCPALLRPLPNLKTNPMTPMLKYIPKTQWQLDREREYQDQRRFLWLALVAISTTLFLVAKIARSDFAADVLISLLSLR